MNKGGSGFALFVLLIWGLAGWALVIKPFVIKDGTASAILPVTNTATRTAPANPPPAGSGNAAPAPAATVVSAGNGVFVGVEPGYVTSWRVDAGGKLTRIDAQQTVGMDQRMHDMGYAAAPTPPAPPAAGSAKP